MVVRRPAPGTTSVEPAARAQGLVQPDPPLWSYVLLDDHPTIMQRIALANAWAARARRP